MGETDRRVCAAATCARLLQSIMGLWEATSKERGGQLPGVVFRKRDRRRRRLISGSVKEILFHVWSLPFRVGHNEIIGVCRVANSAEGLGRDHWNEMLAYPRKPIAHWHPLVEVKKSFKEVRNTVHIFSQIMMCYRQLSNRKVFFKKMLSSYVKSISQELLIIVQV